MSEQEKITEAEIADTRHAYGILAATRLKDTGVDTVEHLALVIAMVPRLLAERAEDKATIERLREQRNEAREAARYHFARAGTFSAEWVLRHKPWSWLGYINPDTGPVANGPAHDEYYDSKAAEAEGGENDT